MSWKNSCMFKKDIYSSVIDWLVLQVFVRSACFIVFKPFISLLLFYPVVLSIESIDICIIFNFLFSFQFFIYVLCICELCVYVHKLLQFLCLTEGLILYHKKKNSFLSLLIICLGIYFVSFSFFIPYLSFGINIVNISLVCCLYRMHLFLFFT